MENNFLFPVFGESETEAASPTEPTESGAITIMREISPVEWETLLGEIFALKTSNEQVQALVKGLFRYDETLQQYSGPGGDFYQKNLANVVRISDLAEKSINGTLENYNIAFQRIKALSALNHFNELKSYLGGYHDTVTTPKLEAYLNKMFVVVDKQSVENQNVITTATNLISSNRTVAVKVDTSVQQLKSFEESFKAASDRLMETTLVEVKAARAEVKASLAVAAHWQRLFYWAFYGALAVLVVVVVSFVWHNNRVIDGIYKREVVQRDSTITSLRAKLAALKKQ